MIKKSIELRAYGALLGILAIVGSWLMLKPQNTITELWVVSDSLEWWLAWGMLVSGVIQLAGALWPCRKLRQYGFAFTSLGWFVLLGVFLTHVLFSLITVIVAIMGLANFVCHVQDVRNKPRAECLYR